VGDKAAIHGDSTDYGTMFGMCLASEFLGHNAGAAHKYTCFETPATWWQHFKEECFPAWLCCWFPVKRRSETRRIDFQAHIVYPEAPAFKPDWMDNQSVRFQYQERVIENEQ
ncbi:unnamed protein product, partial [marine sediment metagenome]